MKNSPKAVVASAEQGRDLTEPGLEDLRDAQRRAEDQSRIDSIKNARRNKFAEMIDQKVYIVDWTHPSLFHKESNRQTAVTEFYPDLNLAVDKFFHFDEWEIMLTKFKKEALNAAGIKYVALTPDKDLADVLVEIETQTMKAA